MVVAPDVPENTTEAVAATSAPSAPGADHASLSEDERKERLDAVVALIELIRPAVQADGGDLALVNADVVAGVIDVELQGSCSSCAISSTTLQAGVNRILRDRLDWVTEVRGGVDDTMSYEESAAMGTGGYVPKF
jgi:Fe-S cluster biogenesis protein NfuA